MIYTDMMGVTSWVCGLMRHNYEALGFIPAPDVEHHYVRRGRCILQRDERGRAVGYLLHGVIRYGQPARIVQHCIEYDRRLNGYGREAFGELLRRCQLRGASAIHLRVAEDLEAVQFWQNCGFSTIRIVPGGKSRNRMIVEMRLPLVLPLLSILKNPQTVET